MGAYATNIFLAKYLVQSLQYWCKVHPRSSRRVSCSVSGSSRSSSSVDTLLMLNCFSTFMKSLWKNFLLTTHDVAESAIDGMRENITPLVLRCTPCGNSSNYKKPRAEARVKARATRMKYHEK